MYIYSAWFPALEYGHCNRCWSIPTMETGQGNTACCKKMAKHLALVRGRLGRHCLPEVLSSVPIWNSGRGHFAIYSMAKNSILKSGLTDFSQKYSKFLPIS